MSERRSPIERGAGGPAAARSCRRHDRARAGLTLIEVLIVVAIGSVVTGAILLTWFSLGDSYSMTSSSTKARELARDAVARMARELRDAEPKGSDAALLSVSTDDIVFTTTFNDPANTQVDSEPVLTRYWYEPGTGGVGVIHRQRDTDGDEKLFETDGSRDLGDRDMVVVRNVLNPVVDGHATIFTYSYIDPDGNLVKKGPPPTEVGSIPTIFLIHIGLEIDLNPQSAPLPMELNTTVQLRNQSRF